MLMRLAKRVSYQAWLCPVLHHIIPLLSRLRQSHGWGESQPGRLFGEITLELNNYCCLFK